MRSLVEKGCLELVYVYVRYVGICEDEGMLVVAWGKMTSHSRERIS